VKNRTSMILAALEQQPVKADTQRAPRNEHEAKLLAEQAYQEGIGHVKAGRWGAAAPAMQRAAQLLPTSKEYNLHAKWSAFRARPIDVPQHRGDRIEIAKQALVAVKADPNFAFGYYVAGNVAMLDDDFPQAHRLLVRATKLDPENLDAARLLRLVERRVKGEGEGGGILSKKLW
jgi:tetratricopeptide (TPR) repeat protein